MYIHIYMCIYTERERERASESNANMNNIKHQISTYSKREGEGVYTYGHTRRNACFSDRLSIACGTIGLVSGYRLLIIVFLRHRRVVIAPGAIGSQS